MAVALHVILMMLAVVCFGLAALDVVIPRVKLVAAGLFFWALAVTIGTSFK